MTQSLALARWMLALCCLPLLTQAAPVPDAILQQAKQLRDQALVDDTAYTLLRDLTTQIGPRLAGTEAEARARQWSVRALQQLGFDRDQIRIERFELDGWVRGEEWARVTTPYPQPLVVTALGDSGSTGPIPVEAEVVLFESIEDVEALTEGALTGKIAYVSHAMGKTQDGSSYAYFGKTRFDGPGIAASKGAKAIMIRSVGTQSHRMAHTGSTKWPEGQTPIPALALSQPDADQLERMAADGETIQVAIKATPRFVGKTRSANLIVDLPGSDRGDEIIITGGHLDSWDLGTGAVDDGAGIAITTAAVDLIRRSGLQPRRSIRLVHWGAEEVGLLGAKAYAEAHADELDRHQLGSGSDFGAGRVYNIGADLPAAADPVVDAMLRLLAPLGVGQTARDYTGSSGPDLSPLNDLGLPSFRLLQDGTDYFDLHHTPDDTFDKIDPEALRQNVAAYAVFLWIAANTDVNFRAQDPAE